jgi:hypothetical protein
VSSAARSPGEAWTSPDDVIAGDPLHPMIPCSSMQQTERDSLLTGKLAVDCV